MSVCMCMFVIEKDNCESPLKTYKILYIPENTKCHICACVGLLVRIRVRVGFGIRVAFVMTSDVDVFSVYVVYIYIYSQIVF